MKENVAERRPCLDKKERNIVMNKVIHTMLHERVEEYGISGLIDAEVLCLLTGIKLEMLKKAIDEFGLIDLLKYSGTMSLTQSQRRKLELLSLYHQRMLISNQKGKVCINSSNSAGEYAIKLYIGKAYECFYIICLDSQNRLNKAKLVHEGTINEAPVYPRVIVETALAYRANSVILSHNHPGGSLKPSQADLDITKKISQALSTINIRVVDHIIVGDERYLSFSEQGLL